MVDESLALGVLGQHGRGACEHWGLQPGDAEIVSASMGTLSRLTSHNTLCHAAGHPSVKRWQKLCCRLPQQSQPAAFHNSTCQRGCWKLLQASHEAMQRQHQHTLGFLLQGTHWRLWEGSARGTGRLWITSGCQGWATASRLPCRLFWQQLLWAP